ncbi:argininosuccinate lyase [Desulfovibrio sp. OttesenSCG-928-G15]|nr:argininosuccinate lyase [Desulfovibrio sp. OttesenSCG-928-G15]
MSNKKLWGGRFAQGQNALVEAYTESVSFDRALYRQDIAGSMAHAAMMARQGVLTTSEADALREGLQGILEEIEAGAFPWDESLEDVHMNIESRLTERLGDVGKKLHTGRSRNDQVALDFRLFVSDSVRQWRMLLAELCAVLADRAEEHAAVLLPGYTHMQPAQPVSLAQHLLAYAAMFRRDASRIDDADKRVRVCPLGAAALAGTTYPFDPSFVAEELAMYGVFSNSMDAVSDRDFVLESLFCGATIMMHLSRLCEDIVLWANPLFGYVRLPDAYATGSSIMPQKKNPDVAELMRGKTGRAYGALMGLMTTLKGLPMTYNRDLQEDKEPFLDMDSTIQASLRLMAGMMREMAFVPERMQEALAKGFLNATELADYLVGKGIAFREAHHHTGKAVAEAEKRGVGLEELPLEALQAICPRIDEDVYGILDYAKAVARRETSGGTGPQSIKKQLADLRDWLQ